LRAFEDLQAFSGRSTQSYTILRGSCLDQIDHADVVDFAVFSPPYPNSFDYTDIYNLELWVLGYLHNRVDNVNLRMKTLRSHVQVRLQKRGQPVASEKLSAVILELNEKKGELWDPRIPEMILGYFSDLQMLLEKLHAKVRSGGSVFAIVGDSSYCGVSVPVGPILGEIASTIGYECRAVESLRQMRLSAQQGGQRELDESLVHLIV
jgi:hypothetical protein